MNKRNNSNIDLLKVICILFIIGHHFIYDSFMDKEINNLFYLLLYMGGKFATVVFVLITGYFLSKKKFNKEKLIKYVLKVDIISWIFLIIYYLLNMFDISKTDIIKCIFPIMLNRYWFATSYFILFLLYPFLNKIINNIKKKEFIILIIIMTLYNIVLPMIGMSYFNNNILDFILFYLIGAYIREYKVSLIKGNHYNFLLWIFSYALMLLSIILINLISNHYEYFEGKSYRLISLNSPLVLISAVLFFIFFSRIHIKPRKWLTQMSASSLGVYLIHDNFFVKKSIFPFLFNYTTAYNIIMIPFILLLVFLICVLIDIIISFIINKIMKIIYNKDKVIV